MTSISQKTCSAPSARYNIELLHNLLHIVLYLTFSLCKILTFFHFHYVKYRTTTHSATHSSVFYRTEGVAQFFFVQFFGSQWRGRSPQLLTWKYPCVMVITSFWSTMICPSTKFEVLCQKVLLWPMPTSVTHGSINQKNISHILASFEKNTMYIFIVCRTHSAVNTCLRRR